MIESTLSYDLRGQRWPVSTRQSRWCPAFGSGRALALFGKEIMLTELVPRLLTLDVRSFYFQIFFVGSIFLSCSSLPPSLSFSVLPTSLPPQITALEAELSQTRATSSQYEGLCEEYKTQVHTDLHVHAHKYMRKGLGIYLENCEKPAATWD